MTTIQLLGRAAVFAAVLCTAAVVRAEVPATTPAGAAVPGPASALPETGCSIAPDRVRLSYRLPRVARRLAAGQPIKIVALGSSSTYGAGASTSAASYPSRLAEELSRQFPGHEISVLNRGVNGEVITDMLARLDAAIIAEQPDLVLWQLGTNSVLQDKALPPHTQYLHEGLERLKRSGADVVLIDLQYAPKVLAHSSWKGMLSLIAATAKAEHVGLFRRFDLMRDWFLVKHLPFETFLSPDGLHMNDWSYACLGKALAMAIAQEASVPTAAAARLSIPAQW
jgi:acyl-CoA thioesterase-1